jgi:poly-gamma-glutamate capsule biosynthesis protein CapA/YwtB (metallophosphatase superfamily)
VDAKVLSVDVPLQRVEPVGDEPALTADVAVAVHAPGPPCVLTASSALPVAAASQVRRTGPVKAVERRDAWYDRTLFLCGDVMTGRGVDQILGRPGDPRLWERHIHDACGYVELAERASGPIPAPVPTEWIWGEALDELDRRRPDVRIVNLETSVTVSDECWPGKEIHYRMHPANVAVLKAARIDVCVLANNHVLDFGRAGLAETLDTLRAAGIATAGAGDLESARRPAVVDLGPRGRVVVAAACATSSGLPPGWAATEDQPGVHLLRDLSPDSADALAALAVADKRAGDVVVASIHWGSNWGYEATHDQVRFAHRLIDAGVDVVHGHSSHHPRPVEVYRGRLVLYGCGDLINDYEGIPGYEAFRGDLTLQYFPTVAPPGELVKVDMVPFRIRRMRLERASGVDGRWLRDVLSSISRRFASNIAASGEGTLLLRPASPPHRPTDPRVAAQADPES